jgi:hypothetical protein
MMSTQHARLGASSSGIWMNCTGAPNLWDMVPTSKKSKPSYWAAEGSAAHMVAESELRREGLYPVGSKIQIDDFEITVTREMLDAVTHYVEECEALSKGADFTELEHEVTLDPLFSPNSPPEPLFGTTDFVAVKGSTMYLRDYKHGAGTVVEATTSQLKYYATAAYFGLPANLRAQIVTVDMGIVQPRAPHPDGPVRNHVMTLKELSVWAKEELKPKIIEVQTSKTLTTGDHCKFCRALAVCPKVLEKTQGLARASFSLDPLPLDPSMMPAFSAPSTPVASPVPQNPQTLTNQQLADVQNFSSTIKGWLEAVQAEVQSRLESATPVPGWKLVPKRGRRVWRDDAETLKYLVNTCGIDPKSVSHIKVSGVPDIEKFLKNSYPGVFQNMSSLIDPGGEGNTIAPEDDRRPAVTRPKARDVFAANPLPED